MYFINLTILSYFIGKVKACPSASQVFYPKVLEKHQTTCLFIGKETKQTENLSQTRKKLKIED